MNDPDPKAPPSPPLSYHRFNPAPDRRRRVAIHAFFLALRAVPAFFCAALALSVCLRGGGANLTIGGLVALAALLFSLSLVRPFKTMLEAARGKYVDPF